jgi:hypothetical protein
MVEPLKPAVDILLKLLLLDQLNIEDLVLIKTLKKIDGVKDTA